jgi:superfamily II DNA or RNA helicase
LTNTKYRIGLTGTLDGSLTNTLVIEGLTGPVYKVISTRELMNQGHVTDLKIKCVLLEYPDEVRKIISKVKYQTEIDFIVTNQKRNKILMNAALSCSGNTLLLFQYVEKHGKVLYDMIQTRCSELGRSVYLIYGDTPANEREAIRHKIENETNSIIIGSYQTVSTGINIPSLENIIFGSPSKSRVRNLQSIGRGLRLKDGKSSCILFDIADDLSWGKKKNYTLTHFLERIKIYTEEQFQYNVHKVSV